jgi:hypothetical protein
MQVSGPREVISFGTCRECGTSGQFVKVGGTTRLRPVPTEGEAAFQDDIAAILRSLGISDHARPTSPHNVVLDEILPAIAALRSSGGGS